MGEHSCGAAAVERRHERELAAIERQRDDLLAMLRDTRTAVASLREDALGWIKEEPRGPGDAWKLWAIRDQLIDQIDAEVAKATEEGH